MKKVKRQRREERENNYRTGITEGESDDEICTSFTKKSNLHESLPDVENPEMDPEYLSYLMAQNLAHKEAKKQKKIEKRFALNLLHQAQDSSWEEHELARLFMLMTEAIDLSKKKRIKFLKKSKLCGTEFLACLGDHGLVLSPKDFMSIIKSKAKNPNELVRVLDQNLDQNVVSVSDMDFISFMHSLIHQEEYTPKQSLQIIRTLCSHSNSLTVCGQILNTFFQDLDTATACRQMSDILSHPFVFDLEGTMSDFLTQFQEINSSMEEMLSSLFRLDDFGKIIPHAESDEDENGNLKGFIDDDDEDDENCYLVAHDGLSSSTESDEGDDEEEEDNSLFSEEDLDEEEAGEHLEFSEEEEEEEEFEDQKHGNRGGYHIAHPSRSEQKKHTLSAAKRGGIFHEKKIKVSHTSHSSSRGDRNEEMILETIEVDIPATASGVNGRVTVVESSEDEEVRHHHRSKHSKKVKGGGKRKNLRAPSGKRVIIHDTSSEEEADL